MSDNVDDLAGIAADTLRRGRAERYASGEANAQIANEPGAVSAKSAINVEPGQIHVLATLAGEDALIAAELPVFQRGGMLVRPAAWSVPASDERTTLAAGLRPINAHALIDLLAQAAVVDALQRPQEEALSDPIHRFSRCRRPAEPERLLACPRHRWYHHDANYATRRLDPRRAGVRSDDTPLSPGRSQSTHAADRHHSRRCRARPGHELVDTASPAFRLSPRLIASVATVRADLAMRFVAPSAWCRCTP